MDDRDVVMIDVNDAAVVTFAPCGGVVAIGTVDTAWVAEAVGAGCRQVVMLRADVDLDWCACSPDCWEVGS